MPDGSDGRESGQTHPSSSRHRRRDALVPAIPVVTALALAGLYVVGVLVKTTQLLGAGVGVRDALPLVPLQQLLQIGIGTAAVSAYALILLPLVLYASSWVIGETVDGLLEDVRALSRAPAATTPEEALKELEDLLHGRVGRLVLQIVRRAGSGALLALGVLLVMLAVLLAAGLLVVLAFFAPWTALLGAVLLALVVLAARLLPQRVRLSRALIGWTLTAYVLGISVVAEYFNPQPLAAVEALTSKGAPLEGRLVVLTDSTLALSAKPHELQVYPLDGIVSVRVRSVARSHGYGEETLVDLLTQ